MEDALAFMPPSLGWKAGNRFPGYFIEALHGAEVDILAYRECLSSELHGFVRIKVADRWWFFYDDPCDEVLWSLGDEFVQAMLHVKNIAMYWSTRKDFFGISVMDPLMGDDKLLEGVFSASLNPAFKT